MFNFVPLVFYMKKIPLLCLGLLLCAPCWAQDEQKQGQWDGKTESLTTSEYLGHHDVPPQFGILSYFNAPWRWYMDTWPAQRWLNFPGAGWTGDAKYYEAQAQLMSECGIRFVRLEIGWGNLDWNDELPAGFKARMGKQLALCKQYGLRPMILLNAHHGAPVPLRGFETQLLADAAAGDRTIKIAPDTKVRAGYTGLVNQGNYKAAFPLITQLDADGTARLSAPLPKELKAGKLPLQELKYQPLQGANLKDGTDVPASQETIDGWLKYMRAVGTFVREQVGTATDSGFDIEVWNEMTFGSDFLDINRYYEPKRDIEPLVYRKTRAWTPRLRPDAKLEFEQKGPEVLLPLTVDFFNDAANVFKNVAVVSGFSNQRPWDNGSTMWDGQGGISKHYYTGTTLREVSPETPLGHKDSATVDANNGFDGKKDPNNREWHGIIPGTNFVPKVTLSLPEWSHFAFQTETIQRDLFPDSRYAKGIGGTPFGRYTNNGDRVPPRYWQTEVNYDRSAFIDRVKKESGARNDDPRLIALNDWTNSKHMLRQYVFHCHKGFERIYLFSTAFDDFSIGLLPQAFYKALDANGYQLKDAVRKTVPQGWWATKWVTDLMKTGTPLDQTRRVRVDRLVEHLPRLVFKGDGTMQHPSRYHSDYFAILPFQLAPGKFAIAYYVATPNATQAWDETKDALDPARYDMPPQQFDVVFSEILARGAKVSAFDPLKNQAVPVQKLPTWDGSPAGLNLRLSVTDYPRFLIVEEASPGPAIIAPQISASPAKVTVKWHTNVVPQIMSVNYGRDWQNRATSSVDLKIAKNQRDFEVTLPVGDADMVAVRLSMFYDGRSVDWPFWDEDPAGQITMPDAKPRPANQPLPPPVPTETPLQDWQAPADIALTLARFRGDIRFSVPQTATPNTPESPTLWTWGKGQSEITLFAEVKTGGAKNANDYLPIVATTDTVTRRRVKLPSGLEAFAVDFVYEPTAHPGMAKPEAARYLLIPRQADMIVLRVVGPAAAIAWQSKTIDAVWGSVKGN